MKVQVICFRVVFVLFQTSKTGDIGIAWSLQLSSPVLNPLREPNINPAWDENTFLLLSGARPVGLDLLRKDAACSVGVAFGRVATKVSRWIGSCCADKSSVLLPLNSNAFLIFLVMTTSGHVTRIFPFIDSSAKGCKDSSVVVEYIVGEGVSGCGIIYK